LKAGKPGVVKSLTSVPIGNAPGMPVWYKGLVNRIIKEGNEIESGMERVIVHSSELPGSKTKLYVTQELDTGNVMVDIGTGKHGFVAGHLGQPIRLEYKAAEAIEPTISKTGKVTHKGGKTKPEFNIEEAEFSGGHPENVKFEESTLNKYGEQGSDLSEVEQFATGKSGVSSGKSSGVLNEKGSKQLRKDLSETKKRQQTEYESGKAEADAERWADEDFATGGRVPLAGGGAAWKLFQEFVERLFIKSSNEIRRGEGLFKGLTVEQKIKQHDNLTKLSEKFRKTGEFDKGANEYFGFDAEKAFKYHTNAKEVEALEKFKPTGKGNAEGGLAHLLGE